MCSGSPLVGADVETWPDWDELCHVLRNGLLRIHQANRRVLMGKDVQINATEIALVIKQIERFLRNVESHHT